METGDDKKPDAPCPECGGKEYKPKYNNNNDDKEQVRVECTNCCRLFQLHPRRKPHRGGYKKKAKVEEPAQFRVLVKRCDRCGETNAKFHGLNNNDPLQPRYKCLNKKSSPLSRSPASHPTSEATKGERVRVVVSTAHDTPLRSQVLPRSIHLATTCPDLHGPLPSKTFTEEERACGVDMRSRCHHRT